MAGDTTFEVLLLSAQGASVDPARARVTVQLVSKEQFQAQNRRGDGAAAEGRLAKELEVLSLPPPFV